MPSCRADAAVAELLRHSEERLGRRVLEAEPLAGGYTPQRVFRLRLAGGTTCVLKAAPPPEVDGRLDWPGELDREIRLYATRPDLDRWRPAHFGDFSVGGWRALLMEDVGACLSPGWSAEEVRRVARGLAEFHSCARGLIHGDVRADNLALDPARGLVLFDWAQAGPGSNLEDVVYWAVGVSLATTNPPDSALEQYAAGGPAIATDRLMAAVDVLLDLTCRRLARPDEPASVRDLRQREMRVLRAWGASISV